MEMSFTELGVVFKTQPLVCNDSRAQKYLSKVLGKMKIY